MPVPKPTSNTEKEFRTCSVSLNQVLRADMSQEVREIVIAKIGKIIVDISDYTIQFGELIHTLMLIFKNGMFTVQDNALDFE